MQKFRKISSEDSQLVAQIGNTLLIISKELEKLAKSKRNPLLHSKDISNHTKDSSMKIKEPAIMELLIKDSASNYAGMYLKNP
jgi:hypothetical protein